MASLITKIDDRKVKRRGRGPLVLSILLLVILGGFIAYFAIAYLGSTRLEEAIAEADRLDPGWRFADLENQRLPYPQPDKNGIDQVLRVRSAVPASAGPQWLGSLTKADQAIFEELRWVAEPSSAADRMPPTLLNAEQERLLRELLTRSAEAVELARQMPDYPYGRYSTTWTKDFVSTLLPHVQEAREVADLLGYDARLRAQGSDVAGACHDVKAILYASRAIGDEEILISQLVRIACDRVAVRILEKILACGRAPEKTLLDLQKEFEQEAQTPFFLTGLRGERAGMDYMLENIEKGKISLEEYRRLVNGFATFYAMVYESPSRNGFLMDLNCLRLYSNVSGERAKMLHYLNEMVAFAKLPPWEMVDAVEAKDKELKQDPYFWVLDHAYCGNIARDDVRAKAEMRSAYTALAMERFHLAKGRWPDKLQELVPDYLSAVPIDPFDGAPLRLARKDSSILVYSVSDDKEDQGGTFVGGPKAMGADAGFVLLEPAHRRQPGKPPKVWERPMPPVQEAGDGKP
jgi:hypothetical protein